MLLFYLSFIFLHGASSLLENSKDKSCSNSVFFFLLITSISEELETTISPDNNEPAFDSRNRNYHKIRHFEKKKKKNI